MWERKYINLHEIVENSLWNLHKRNKSSFDKKKITFSSTVLVRVISRNAHKSQTCNYVKTKHDKLVTVRGTVLTERAVRFGNMFNWHSSYYSVGNATFVLLFIS
jgi:hypothetical protein